MSKWHSRRSTERKAVAALERELTSEYQDKLARQLDAQICAAQTAVDTRCAERCAQIQAVASQEVVTADDVKALMTRLGYGTK